MPRFIGHICSSARRIFDSVAVATARKSNTADGQQAHLGLRFASAVAERVPNHTDAVGFSPHRSRSQLNSHSPKPMKDLLHHSIYLLVLQRVVLGPERDGIGYRFIPR